jgi:uncharacterized protein (DUF2267 family)
MNLHDMLGPVSNQTGMDREQTEKVTRAFLETLALRLDDNEARELAMQLPMELQNALALTEPEIEKLSPDELLSRFDGAVGLDEARADQAARAVWRALKDAVSAGEVGDVKSQLPSELNALFEGTRAPSPAGGAR